MSSASASAATMGEPYRTLLGHFRHEVGHHYWARLIQFDPDELAALPRRVRRRARSITPTALQNHYGSGSSRRGPTIMSAPTPPRTRGRISPRPSPTCSTSSIRWRRCGGFGTHAGAVSGAGGASRRGRRFRSLSRADRRAGRADRALLVRAQRDQPQHGPARSLPVPPLAGDRRQARLCERPGRAQIGPPMAPTVAEAA